MRVHALGQRLHEVAGAGIVDITPGVRSLHVHFDPAVTTSRRIAALLVEVELSLPAARDLAVSSRVLRLPMSWADPVTDEAIARYSSGVRPTAPWNPSNIEFIRRVNGLDSTEDVRRIVFDAEYLVLGLGDVYLGAPLAVPVDPRHRLLTTKYNPARTWTAADTVGLGGQYLCVYGMDSPGGYQLVGRTVPIWSGHRQRTVFEPGSPWLLRFFDRISWLPVSAEELLKQREFFRAGRLPVEVEEGTFSLGRHLDFLADNADSIERFRRSQHTAFEAERQAWVAAGEFDRPDVPQAEPDSTELEVADGHFVVDAPMVGTVWRCHVAPGTVVEYGRPLVTLEAMKLELAVTAPIAGTVVSVLVASGASVSGGAPLVVIEPAEEAAA
jgi:urea carboxylase